MRLSFQTVLTIVLALLLVVFSAVAQDEADAEIILTTEGFTVPEMVEAGLTTLAFSNQTPAPLTPLFVRLNTDVTIEDFMAALEEGEEAAISLVALLGSTAVLPNDVVEVTYALQPGTHLLLNFSEQGPPQIGQFEVTGMASEDIEMPETDLTVSLVDFAFAIPLTISAGEQTWLIRNIGEQWHEVGIMEVGPDMTINEIRDAFLSEMEEPQESGDESEGPVGDEQFPAFLWLPMSPGEEAVVSVNIEAGTYAVICYLPDFASGHSHAELGMFQIITVE
jgi:hypothetical protein